MNESIINELKSKKRDIEAGMEFFENCGIDFGNASFCGTNIHYRKMTYDEMCDELHRLRSLGFDMTMNNYFYCYGLTVCYKSSKTHHGFIFTVSDEDYAIAKLGGGKCQIKQSSRTEKTVVCSVPE